VVDKATWYRIKSIYNAVKGIAELQSEGISFEEIERLFPRELGVGDEGIGVQSIQYYLAVIAYFNDSIPTPPFDGIFGEATEQSVKAFQRELGLEPSGIVDRATWNAIVKRYDEVIAALPSAVGEESAATAYPGSFLSLGRQGEEVLRLQRFINDAAARYSYVPAVAEDGIFGQSTERAVKAIQENSGIDPTGAVGPVTWERIVTLSGARE
jgi:peptidoglycan hydrolase-like protein with peptidoglycan-binding domain